MLMKFKEWKENPSSVPKVKLMYGAGEKAFCAGGDIKYANFVVKTRHEWHRLFRTFHLDLYHL